MFCVLMIIFFSIGAFSQDYSKLKEKYKKFSYVYLVKSRKIKVFTDKNDKLNITEERYIKKLYLNNKAAYYTDDEISYSSFDSLLSINVYTQVPVKGKYKKVKTKEFQKEKIITDRVFYDNITRVSFFFPSLKEDAVSNLKYKLLLKEPRLLNSFVFQEYRPVIKSELIVETGENINVGFLKFNTDTFNIKYLENKEKGKKIYTFITENINEFKTEENTAGYLYYVPHIIPYIDSYRVNDSTINLMGTVSRLFGWYKSLLKKADTSNTEKLRKKAEELVSGSKSEGEKVEKIFNWVQRNIKYIAEEDGLGGFIPDAPKNVFNKRYGDCKGKSFLLKTMLQSINIKSYLTWTGSNSLPYKYNENPTPSADNHIIVTYVSPENNILYLDATSKNIPFGKPTSFIQGKEVLIDKGNKYEINTVPICPAKDNRMKDSSDVRIDGTNLKGEGKTELTGYFYVKNKDYYDDETDIEKRKEFYNLNFNKGNNKFLIKHFSESVDKNKNIFKVDYDFIIGDYVIRTEKSIFVNMNLFKDVLTDKIKKTDKYDKFYDNKLSYDNYFNLQIPKEWKIDYIPENVKFQNKFFKYDIEYLIKDNIIFYHFYVEYNAVKLTKDQFLLYNDFIKSLNKSFRQSISLIKK